MQYLQKREQCVTVPAHFFPFEKSAAPSASTAPSSTQLVAPCPHAASGKLSFCNQTLEAGCTSHHKPPALDSPVPAPCRGGWGLPCFIQLHRVEALDLLPKPGILIQGSVQLGGMHQLTGDFYTVGEVLGHTLAGIGVSLGLSMNFEAVTAHYVDVRLERKKEVLDAYHGAVKQADPAKAKEAEPKKARNAEKKKSNEIEL